ncbi:copper amine oxidase N-terminal domain-containing protein [Paenibacillus psychroresistens]|uniref:Copper amine oxidase N-terminal domain-containing protein n=1 Tax=Paenibacillus psychroresistens TaxID=1778678 RepID=A0A6B8RT63_9BACL|nr:copper amine oxidase N-terminal domain-containing protein [Paenibacillus psychroresistens]QGQ98942.1 copper amine oxidase N-terminal domain-containing protein [Paenibacillus psychroresistens]
MGKSRRRLLVLIVSLIMLFTFVVPAMAADENYRTVGVTVDGVKLDATAYIVDGRTVVPLRAIFEKLNAALLWDSKDRSITATRNGVTIWLAIDNTKAQIGDKATVLDVPPLLIDSKTYVPLRFVSEALGAEVTFDNVKFIASVKSSKSCSLQGGQTHSGYITPGGETWGVCGSPHFVKGAFEVSGADSPVLTIEAGATIRFEAGAHIYVGSESNGGLVIKGTLDLPVLLTADSTSPFAGIWGGISFLSHTIRGEAIIEGTKIEYGTSPITVGYTDDAVEVTVKDTTITNSSNSGIILLGNSRLSADSGNLTISGTKVDSDGMGGYPIVTSGRGSGSIPAGTYSGNVFDYINVFNPGSVGQDIITNTTWHNVGVPYRVSLDVYIDSPAYPILSLEPGVQVYFGRNVSLSVNQGGIKAEGTTDLPITFSSRDSFAGSWNGIRLSVNAKPAYSIFTNSLIEYATFGIAFESDLGPVITNSTFQHNKAMGIYLPFIEGGSNYVTTGGNVFNDNPINQNTD